MTPIEQTKPQQSKGGLSPRMRWLLIGSLTLNLLVVGLGAGLALRHAGGPPERPHASRNLSFNFGSWGLGLTRDDFRALRRGVDADGYDMRADMASEGGDRAEIIRLLRASPFDPQAVSDVVSRMEARAQDRMAMGNRVMLSYLQSMSQNERMAFADRMEDAAKRKHERPKTPEANKP